MTNFKQLEGDKAFGHRATINTIHYNCKFHKYGERKREERGGEGA